MWKVFERNLKIVQENNLSNSGQLAMGIVPTKAAYQPSKPLTLPKLALHDTIVAAVPRRIYANGNNLN